MQVRLSLGGGLNAPTAKAREQIAKQIRKHARDKAREILR
jgi:hypothetical protein